jgi:hypothetical protein
MQIHWQAGTQSGIRNFRNVQDCAKWVDHFLRSFPSASITPNP